MFSKSFLFISLIILVNGLNAFSTNDETPIEDLFGVKNSVLSKFESLTEACEFIHQSKAFESLHKLLMLLQYREKDSFACSSSLEEESIIQSISSLNKNKSMGTMLINACIGRDLKFFRFLLLDCKVKPEEHEIILKYFHKLLNANNK